MILVLALLVSAEGAGLGPCRAEYSAMVERITASWASPTGKAAVIQAAAARRDECEYRLHEGERAAARAAENERAESARLAAIAQAKAEVRSQATPAIVRALNSALLCSHEEERQAALAAIAKEHKYAKIGGVIHKDRLAEAQDELADADDAIGVVRDEMKAAKQKPLSCKTAEVAKLASCLDAKRDGENPADPCQADKIQLALRILDAD